MSNRASDVPPATPSEDRVDDPVERTVLDAAERLLREVGETFTMERLETASGVSRATIYRRVGGKTELLERLAAIRGEPFEPDDPRRAILRATRGVLAREGLAGATMEQFADAAGVGVATVYRHFGDKDGLLTAFAEEMTPRGAVRELALSPGDDVAADLERIVPALLRFFFEHRDLFRLVLMGSEDERRYLRGLRGRSDSTLERLTEYFETQLGAGRLVGAADPDELALALMGMVLSFAVIGPLHYGTALDDPDASGERIVRLLLDDLRVGGAERDAP